jgi:hypothetical protein
VNSPYRELSWCDLLAIYCRTACDCPFDLVRFALFRVFHVVGLCVYPYFQRCQASRCQQRGVDLTVMPATADNPAPKTRNNCDPVLPLRKSHRIPSDAFSDTQLTRADEWRGCVLCYSICRLLETPFHCEATHNFCGLPKALLKG